MEAPDLNLYEYAVVRLVPDIERGEYVNVGLLMLCKRRKRLIAKTFFDAGRCSALRGFDRLDPDAVKRQLQLFERQDVPDANLPVEEKYRWLAAAKSAILQVSPSHAAISPTDDLDAEFSRLFTRLIL